MSSGMKLRSRVRAPQRYGEEDTETPAATLLQSMRQARGQAQDARSRVVEFNPNLPAAAFPTLDHPRPKCEAKGLGQNGAANSCLGGPDQQHVQSGAVQQQRKAISDGDGVPKQQPTRVLFDHVSLDQVDNYAASNSRANLIYIRNLEIMSGANTDAGADRNLDMEDSDLEETVDASDALGSKHQIHNPSWSDLNPAIQVEIIESMLKTGCWRKVCRKLGLGADDRRKFAAYLDTRNKQIARENKQLSNMRAKQLRALLRIDDSTLKTNRVPPQLVLRRIFRKTSRALRESQEQDLLMCQAADVLAARQFLHQHGLPRSYAGDWGHSMVVLREAEDDGLEETFEWKEDLGSSPEVSDTSVNGLEEDQTTLTRKQFIKSVGQGSTINPKDLTRRSDDEQPIVDWGRYFPYWHSDSTSKPCRRRSDGLVRLRIGTQQAAQIQQLEKSLGPSLQRVQPLHSSSPPVYLEETPSMLREDAETFSDFGQEISKSLPRRAAQPVARSLGGQWSLYSLDPAAGQARYRQQIEQAQLEMQLRESEKQRRRNNEEEMMTEQMDRAEPVPAPSLPSEVMSPQPDKLWDPEATPSKTVVGDVNPAVLADIQDMLVTDPTSFEEAHEHMFLDESSTGDDEGSWFDEVDEMVLVPNSESAQPPSSPP